MAHECSHQASSCPRPSSTSSASTSRGISTAGWHAIGAYVPTYENDADLSPEDSQVLAALMGIGDSTELLEFLA